METLIESSKEKGSKLEREFANFMKDKLGYDKCLLNQKVKGKISTNEYEVDIIGKKLSEKGENMKNIGTLILIAAGIVFLAWLFEFMPISTDIILVLVVASLGAGVILQVAKENEYDYTWVECKAHKTKIGKDTINILKDKSVDYHKSDDKEFQFTKLILASETGFIMNAIRFANEYNIELYERISENDFKPIKTIEL
jgi:hypothetical protein